MQRTDLKEQIKSHYSEQASNRSSRLKTDEINPSLHNHKLRNRLISRLFAKGVFLGRGIDIGTGTGVWAEFLANYCSAVDGVDFVEENIAIARENAQELELESRILYYQDDVERLSNMKDEDYDVALMISVLQHLPDKDKALRRIHDILKSEGLFVILVHNRRCIFNYSLRKARKTGADLPINEYSTLSELETQLLDSGFCVQSKLLLWLFFTDFLFLGRGRTFAKILLPFRIMLIVVSTWLEMLLARFTSLNFLFREIIIVCSKKELPEETKAK